MRSRRAAPTWGCAVSADIAIRTVLPEQEWRERQRRHRARVEEWTHPRRERRLRGERHPVDDFLFDYYPYSPAKLATWHPGAGVGLAGDADAFLRSDAYVRVGDVVTVGPLPKAAQRRRDLVERLLAATDSRPAQLGCFGLHEWAMVLGRGQEEVRHAGQPLRLPPEGVASLVDEIGLRCTHIDAYRFFTNAAIPLNAHVPTRETQHELEQPGCLHATMDLYKYGMWLSPHVPSDLVADCFALARDARELDMRASPYDLRDLGYPPIEVETPAGRREYAQAQRALAERATPLRRALLDVVRSLGPLPVPA